MKLKFIGTSEDQAWISEMLRNYILHASKPKPNPQTGLFTVYYTLVRGCNPPGGVV
jgi:hypothetical protein